MMIEKKQVSVIMIVLLILNLVFFALQWIGQLLFWIIILIIFIFGKMYIYKKK